MNWEQIFTLVGNATLETLIMVFFSTLFSVILGLPLGILICVTDPVAGIMPKPVLNQFLNRIVDVLRSFPARSVCLARILYTFSSFFEGSPSKTSSPMVYGAYVTPPSIE